VRFQLKNERANVLEWLVQETSRPVYYDMGPAQVVLTKDDFETPRGNALVIIPHVEKDKLNYLIYTASKGVLDKKGVAKVGEPVQTGWMGLEFRALKMYQHAQRKNNYKQLERPTPLSVSAVKLVYRGQEHLLGLNSLLKLFAENSAMILTYGNKRVD